MGVGLKVGSITDEIGAPSYLFSFFSTVSANLERSWGERFPLLMEGLYRGALDSTDAQGLLDELAVIKAEFSKLSPDRVVWNYEDRSQSPPWGGKIAGHIVDLSNYFVTSNGRDLFELFDEAIEELRDRGGTAQIVSF
jgi:2,3-bisphosphoglycerate-dependent phosphoglycerate mutase